MKMSEEEKEEIWKMIRELREKYDLHDSVYTDVDKRAYEQWIKNHDHIPDITEIDEIISEVRSKINNS